MDNIKVIYLQKREICREGVAMILESKPGIEVVAKCSSWLECIEKARELKPTVILMDTEMPQSDCIKSIQTINRVLTGSYVIMFAHPEEDHLVFSALKAGARAYISKDVSIQDLITAITRVSAGEVIISPQIAERFFKEFTLLEETKDAGQQKYDANLSKREEEVLVLVAKGRRNREIAEELFITVTTVKTHLSRILEKLHARNRQEAAVLAVEHGIIPRVVKIET